MSKGRYFVFEGGEGTGKTTQITLLSNELTNKGYEVVTVREPGGTPLGDVIRGLLLEKDGPIFCNASEMLMFFISRTESYDKVVKPALEQDKIVLSDRSYISSWAYQVCARGLGPAYFKAILEGGLAEGHIIQPNLALILDIETKKGMTRARSRSLFDRIEQEEISFHERVREGFLGFKKNFPDHEVAIINAHEQKKRVHQNIMAAVNPYLPKL